MKEPIRSESLVEAELEATNIWFIRLRWIAGASVLIAALVFSQWLKVGIPSGPLWVVGACILFYNLIFHIVAERFKRASASSETYKRLVIWQIMLDWLAIVPLIHFSGGVESPAVFFFVFHIVIASMLLERKTCYFFAGLAIVMFFAVALLEYGGVIPHYPIGLRTYYFQTTTQYTNPVYVAAVLTFFSSTLIIVTFLVTFISERLRSREKEVVALSKTLQSSSARLQALNETANLINSTLDLSQVLNLLVSNTVRVMGVRACSIRLLDPTGTKLEIRAVHGLSQAYLNKGPLELEHDPLDREVLEGKIVNIPDVPQSSLLQYPEWAVQEGFCSMVSAPLIGKNKPLGIMRAYSNDKGHFTPDDEAFLSAIATQGSIAIDNALAYRTIETLGATKDAFIRVFTHELRSPVSVIRSLLQTILAGYAAEVSPQQRDIVERAIRRVDFLRKLIDDLLDLAHGRVPDSTDEITAPVALEEVVERVVKRFDVPAREKSLTLEWNHPEIPADAPARGILVRATVEGLDRIFNNLVSNAVKYTPAGGKVTVTLSQVGKDACITVEDTGIGIPENAMPSLFEEFYRAPNARSIEREGTGLGLAIVRETLQHFGGHIAVRSQLDQGSCFTVTIPTVEVSQN
jgi:signal transduction histidine kinase